MTSRVETNEESPRQLLTILEVARRLGCSRTNVYGLINAGELPVVTIGRSRGYRIDSQDIEDFVRRRKLHRQAEPAEAPPARPRLKHIKL